MQKNKLIDSIVFLLVSLPFIYLAYIYHQLPESVPTHFDIHGKADDFSEKSSLWLIVGILSATSLFIFYLLKFLPKIDPKKNARFGTPIFIKIGIAVSFLLFFLNIMIILSAQSGAIEWTKSLPIIIGLFFAFMGNIMHSLKPNYFAGIRTPWTLESEETWRETHRLAGKLWFVGGLLIALCGLIFPFNISMIILICITVIMAFWPMIFSYTYFKKMQKREKSIKG